MNKSKWMSVAAVLTLSATMAFAGPGEGRGKFGGKHAREGRGGAFSARFADKLDLTESQKLRLAELQKTFREQNKSFFDSMRQTRQELKAAREADDTTRLETLKGTMASQREQMKALHEQQKARITALLTPEQRAKWETLQEDRKDRRGKRGPRGERGAQSKGN
jgi:periplasmic protein CpxP/Spy